MTIQIVGKSGTVADVDGTKFRAIRHTRRPVDCGSMGSYGISAVSGVLAAALSSGANGVVFAARWADATRLAVIQSLRINFIPLDLFTANSSDYPSFSAYVARNFTAAYTGGTALTPSANSAKRRSSMGVSLFNDIRISTTAALTPGTLTLDDFPFVATQRRANRANAVLGTEELVPATNFGADYWRPNTRNGEHPIVLMVNEGIAVRNRTAWPAAGTGQVLVEMNWSEVSAY